MCTVTVTHSCLLSGRMSCASVSPDGIAKMHSCQGQPHHGIFATLIGSRLTRISGPDSIINKKRKDQAVDHNKTDISESESCQPYGIHGLDRLRECANKCCQQRKGQNHQNSQQGVLATILEPASYHVGDRSHRRKEGHEKSEQTSRLIHSSSQSPATLPNECSAINKNHPKSTAQLAASILAITDFGSNSEITKHR
ncbi:hypothetical protein V1293_000532 [Bradyrhizobium sp. AZCC 1693]